MFLQYPTGAATGPRPHLVESFTMPRISTTAIAITLCLLGTAAQAQAVRTEKNMSLELANDLAARSVAACTANGYAVTATVVDRAGTVRAVQRADNAGPHTLEGSRLKAYTSASANNSKPLTDERPDRRCHSSGVKKSSGFTLAAGVIP